ncbi:VWA domain-containing protein, partial [Candidatus Bathyarchaeota archaeon]|nr:VWA domain-containing protein [Candidatus Bathyarchaeota archaeon]
MKSSTFFPISLARFFFFLAAPTSPRPTPNRLLASNPQLNPANEGAPDAPPAIQPNPAKEGTPHAPRSIPPIPPIPRAPPPAATMSDSDAEFVVDDQSDDDIMDHQVTSAADGRPAKKPGKAAWEDVKRSWDTVVEGTDGTLSMAEVLEAEKRRRLLRDTTPLQRGIIRHMVLVIDMSFAMAEKDMLPTRYKLAMGYAAEFVREYFEQNPISQMGVVGMREGIAVRIS